ncbi:zinc transporter [Scenedesmus sp. PABB004]|nr:zinc transporter [Scenedesmus sp. PABB004]
MPRPQGRHRGGALLVLALLGAAAAVRAQTELPVAVADEAHLEALRGDFGDLDAPAAAPTVHLRPPRLPSAPATPPQRGGAGGAGAATPGAARARVPLLAVVALSACMSLMSCLGVLPFFFVARLSKPWAGLANAVASGVMLAASFGLLAEGGGHGGAYLVAGMALGVAFVRVCGEHLEQYEVTGFEQLAGADARRVLLFLGVMALHAVGEGGGVGVSFAGERGWAQGTLVTLAIGLHNVPEGLAVASVMAAKGTPPGRVLLWTALTALPQALVAPPAYVFVDAFRPLLPLAMGFAAGCMIWIVLAELLPDALEACEADAVATYATGGAAWLQGLSVFIASLETPGGTLASPFGDYASVAPAGMAHLLARLGPLCLLPGLAAAGVARRAWPRPLLVGLSAGLLIAHAAGAWLQLLAGSERPLLCGLALPLAGAAGAALLWRHVRSGGGARALGGWSPKAKAHEGGDACCAPAAAHAQLLPPSGAVVVAAASAASHGHAHHRASHAAAPDAWDASGGQQQQQAPPSVGLAGAPWSPAPAAAGWPVRGPAEAGGGGWDATSTSSSGSCSGQQAAGAWGGQASPVKLGGSSPLLLPGRGDALLPVSGCGGALPRGAALVGGWDVGGWGSCSSSRAVVGASLLALGGAAGSQLPLGLQLAGALAAAPSDIGPVLLPTLLLGLMTATASLGLLMPLLGPHRPRLLGAAAGALAALPALTALTALLCVPGWVAQGSAFAAAEGLSGLAAGFNALVLGALVLPAGRVQGPKKCSLGLALGGAAGGMLAAGLGLLCVASPYCLRVRPPGFVASMA